MEDERLQQGFKIPTAFGGQAVVEKYLAEGGQGAVYVVDYKGQKKALKWYKKNALGKSPEKFYDNIKQSSNKFIQNESRNKKLFEYSW